ncbi:PKD domain-containing protein [Paraflavitalea sp. CAU 1676]|uniref:PKD domain-containing protein n=1 Tax=Paraflavitalea sp. CAU 1676 TaxID=3032598 RepID=UPI0023D98341|nr:PKD domain-containing protein [Paraflavitalea sp. CAU 1676]MDF2191071.1 PKD domain-containing protein [Paraflavitalea sp. CAU 1676]
MRFHKLYIAAGLTLAVACTEKETIYLENPASCFEARIKPSNGGNEVIANEAQVDSNFYFELCNRLEDRFMYRWDFGDGSQAEGKSAQHAYSKRGVYNVKLTALRDGHPVDSFVQQMRVYLGQKNFSFARNQHTYGVDLSQTSDEGFLILGYRQDTGTVNPRQYFLLKVDSLLKQQWVKDLPAESVNLLSLQPSADGNHIIAGNTKGVNNKFGLTAINLQGEVVWSKTYDNTNSFNTYASVTNDNAIITIGQKSLSGSAEQRTMLLKTNLQGDVIWEQDFAAMQAIQNAENLVVEEDGFVVAGTLAGSGCASGNCDSVVILKAGSSDGDVLWKNSMRWDYQVPLQATRLIRAGNEYQVVNKANYGIFTFSASGAFLNRQVFWSYPDSLSYHLADVKGNTYFFLKGSSPRYASKIFKVSGQSKTAWYVEIHNPVSGRALPKGGIAVLGARVNQINNGQYAPSKLTIQIVNSDGTDY